MIASTGAGMVRIDKQHVIAVTTEPAGMGAIQLGKIIVYLDSGAIFSYTVRDMATANAAAAELVPDQNELTEQPTSAESE